MLGNKYRMLYSGFYIYMMLDARYWILDTKRERCLVLDVGEKISYKKLKIWQLARELVIDIHKMTLHKLPKHEMFEEGGQIRKSIKSVKSTIVEGYGR